MTGLFKKIFSIENVNMHKQLCILGIKLKWLNQNKYIEARLNDIANNIKIQNDEIANCLNSNFQNFANETKMELKDKEQKFENIVTNSINDIQNNLLNDIDSINTKQILLSEELTAIKENFGNSIYQLQNFLNNELIVSKENIANQATKLKELQSQISLIDSENNKTFTLIKDELLNIKNLNQVDFAYKNFENPQYEFLYNDLYKMFTVGEYYSMKEVYTKRINKYTIDQNINKLKEKYSEKIYLLTDSKEQIDICEVIDIKSINFVENKENAIFVLAYNQDYLGLNAVRELQKYNLKYFALEQYGTPQARYYHINKNAYNTLIEESNNHPLQHYCPGDFENIFQALEATKQLNGDYVEIGTFQGASARATLNYINRANIDIKCYFVDTYEGFTYKETQSTEDLLWTNTHTDTSVQRVQEYLSGYNNFELIKSNIIQNELPNNIQNIRVANIDVDMYEAVKAALYKVKDRMLRNGIVIAEDYGHTPALIGAQKAVDEFLQENPNDFIPIYLRSGQMFLIKK